MHYSLLSKGEIIGEVDSLDVHTPPGYLIGPFVPSPAFAIVRPVLDSFREVSDKVGEDLDKLPLDDMSDAEVGEHGRSYFASDTGLAMQAALRAYEDLKLELRDTEGRVIPCRFFTIEEIDDEDVQGTPGASGELMLCVQLAD